MRLAPVVHITGTLVRLFSPALLTPAAVAALYREWNDVIGFIVAFVCTAGAGIAMRTAGGGDAAEMERLRRVEGIAVVAATWFTLALLSAIPYVWTGLGIVDAVFESMSGLTTTGATVFTAPSSSVRDGRDVVRDVRRTTYGGSVEHGIPAGPARPYLSESTRPTGYGWRGHEGRR